MQNDVIGPLRELAFQFPTEVACRSAGPFPTRSLNRFADGGLI